MPNLNFSLTATDGLLPSPDLNFTPLGELNPAADSTNPQLIRLQVPNMTGVKDHPGFYFGTSDNHNYDFYFYNDGSSTWEAGNFNNNAHVINDYLAIYVPFLTYKRKYICLKASDELHVPDMTNGGIYYKVNDIPLKTEVSQYASYKSGGNASYIPVIYSGIGKFTNGQEYLSTINYYVSAINDHIILSGDEAKPSTAIVNPTGKKVSVQVLVLEPGVKPPSIDERLTTLEDDMQFVKTTLTDMSNRINALSSKVDKLVDVNSAYFVSR